MGFRRAVLSELNRSRLPGDAGLELVGVRDIEAALEALLAPRRSSG
jgi:hypothetical protein